MSEEVTVGQVLAEALADKESGAFVADLRNVADAGRQNDKHPAWIKFWVPDPFVLNLAGDEDKRGYHFYVYVDREWINARVDQIEDPEPSLIVKP